MDEKKERYKKTLKYLGIGVIIYLIVMKVILKDTIINKTIEELFDSIYSFIGSLFS